jgi:tetratricopeptide (TPR) repeat protein
MGKTMGWIIAGASLFIVGAKLLLVGVGLWQSHIEDTGIDQISQGNKLMKAGDPASIGRAAELYKRAADTFHKMEKKEEARNEGLANYDLARAYAAMKQYPQALDAVNRALPLLADDKSKADRADAYGLKAFYLIKTDKSDEALTACREAEPLFRGVGKIDRAQDMLNVEGAIFYDKAVDAARKKNWTAARDACVKSQDLYHQAHSPDDEATAAHELSLIYTVLGDNAHAAEARSQERAIRAAAPAGGK